MIRNGYYFPDKIWENLSHTDKDGNLVGDARIGIEMGTRQAAKTCGTIQYLLKDFFEKGETFVLLTRDEDMRKSKYCEEWLKKFLNISHSDDEETEAILEKCKSLDWKFSADGAWVGGKRLCYCCSLSLSEKWKNKMDFKDVTKIIMDEAVGSGEYSLVINGREAMTRIWEIAVTVGRGSDEAFDRLSIVFIFNVSDYDNWIFEDLGVKEFFQENSKFTCQRGIVIEKVNNEVANSRVLESKMGFIMSKSKSGSAYIKASFENKYMDNTEFCEKIGLDFKKIVYKIMCEAGIIGIFDRGNGMYHVSQIRYDQRGKGVCFDTAYVSQGFELDKSGLRQKFEEMFGKGKVTFQDQRSKKIFLRMLRYY